jgi:triacylglycerol lipase
MKKRHFLTLLIIFTFLPSLLFGFGFNNGDSSSTECLTKYPVVLVHGIAFKDANLTGIDYWYGIEDDLKDQGAVLFVTEQNAFQSHAFRAQQVLEYLLYVKALYGYEKFNLIAHSQGALDSRYLISNLNGKDIVASLSTVSGVHRGTKIADIVLGLASDGIENMVSSVIDSFSEIFYDFEENSDSLASLQNLTTDFMVNDFNPNTPNVDEVYYQSWAGKIKWAAADFIITEALWLAHLYLDGANDAMVSVNSAKWGNWRGTITGAWWCGGVSHFGEIGHLFGFTPGFSAGDFYIDVVKDLKKRGF